MNNSDTVVMTENDTQNYVNTVLIENIESYVNLDSSNTALKKTVKIRSFKEELRPGKQHSSNTAIYSRVTLEPA